MTKFGGCLFLMGSRARKEAGLASDLEFGIILPDAADILAFREAMPVIEHFQKAIFPVELDASHNPWRSYLNTPSNIFKTDPRDVIQAYLFTDARCLSGDTSLLRGARAACHAKLLPLPCERFPVPDLVRSIDSLDTMRVCTMCDYIARLSASSAAATACFVYYSTGMSSHCMVDFGCTMNPCNAPTCFRELTRQGARTA